MNVRLGPRYFRKLPVRSRPAPGTSRQPALHPFASFKGSVVRPESRHPREPRAGVRHDNELQQPESAWKGEWRGHTSVRLLSQFPTNDSSKLQATVVHAKRCSHQSANKQEGTWQRLLHDRGRRPLGDLGRKMMSASSKVWLARNPPQRLRKLSSEQRPRRVKRRRTSAFRSAWRERSERPRKSAEMARELANRALRQQFGKHGV
jgi:hypothetical protein